MICFLSIKYQKTAAWLLYITFCLQSVFPLPAYSSASVRISLPDIKNHIQDLLPVKDNPVFSEAAIAPEKKPSSTKTDIPSTHTKTEKVESIKANGPGPGQPEMQTFQSVNTSNMVDLFTGDFSYNIPLLDVGGYPVNIHYSGGISMDQEASWVGLGWNINPGTISRSMRGIPDDFNGKDSISRTQHVKPNKTAGVTVGGGFELGGLPMRVGASIGVFKNNYNGWGLETGINASINSGSKSSGPLSGGLSITNNSQTGLNVSPSLSVSLKKQEQGLIGGSSLSTNFNSRTGISALQLHTQIRADNDFTKKLSNATHVDVTGIPVSASISFATPSYVPTISMPYTSTQFAFTVKGGSEHWIAHPNVYINGYVSQQEIKPEDVHQSLPAYGYLYYTLANHKPDALLDVNREKETQFNANTSPMIAIPQYTYDLYSISGEGTGGMFRPYRGEIGYVRDHAMTTQSATYNASADFGFGQIFHIGTDFIPIIATTRNGAWKNPGQNAINNYIRFQKKDSTFQEVYFRNPGEKTSNTAAYYQSVGDDALMRIKLGGSKSNITALNTFTLVKNAKQIGEVAVNTPPVKIHRDKRTQVINYLTAQEASLYGLDKGIKSYTENTIPLGNCSDAFTPIPRIDDTVRKKHHISEIDVTNADGRRYVYGLPVYNVLQKEVTFSVDKETNPDNINNGLVSYTPGVDNSVKNSKGKESYFTKDSMPGYAHDFLLTGILSPDYVDITGDGITEDDIGDAVKFNYTQIYGRDKGYFDWRTPYQENMANYNEGLKTYSRDDKGTYLYGKKEVWYLNSIESKTMIAVFVIDSNRMDSKAVKGENGGYDALKGLRKLDEINLYSKADLIANGGNAKPIKTVHFVYSYRLCPGITGTGSAKLTLDSIWFSYNGNFKGKLNPYVFHYSPDANGSPKADYNPSYNPKNYDRWGNFKDPVNNPGNMSNVEYPYSVQDSIAAAKYAAAWQLTDIQLPSSGRLKITYEADDYAYVQNKRAMQFFEIAGFGADPGAVPGNMIYTSSSADNYYLFVNSSTPINDVSDLRAKYFGNNDTVYFKIAVKMPTDRWGSGYEFVPGYGVIADLGITTDNPNQFWIRFQAIDGESPITKAALQFLRLNLPSKAYPGSEIGNNLDFTSAVKMLASSFREIQNAVNGFDKTARQKGYCQIADLSRSFVRLTSPDFKKYGGGSRVKRVELFDNWNQMTGQKEASYGQEYSYTTTEEVNGQKITISSGVASYEPAIGNDENPFRQPIQYAEKIAPLAPVNFMFVEEPVCESFFPSASVGYSKVTVRTINRKAKSANGWDETSFYTSKDFPTLIEYTVLDDYSKKRYNPKLSALLKIRTRNFITLSQGFKVELNDMNGKMKSQASYPETDSLHPIRASYYYYKVDDSRAYQKHLKNNVPIVDSLNGHINPNGIIGKDIEVMVDLREQTSKTVSMQVSPNVDVIPFFPIPFPFPSFWPLPQVEETRFRSAAIVKIIHRYGILDSVVVIDKGSVVSTKNLVYDGETGNVIVSRTNNEFNDPVFNFNYPAYWAYSGMGPAYQNIGAVFYNKEIMCVNGKLFHSADRSDFPAKKYFESGDELWVHSTGAVPYDPGCTVNNNDVSGQSQKLWVMDAAKATDNDKGLYLIDKAGVPYTGVIDSLKVIRSGKRNMVQASAGSIVSLANPMREINPGNFKIVIDSNTQVIHTSATAYKDLWRVENSLYQKDTVVQVYKMFTAFPTINATTFRYKAVHTNPDNNIIKVTPNSPNIGSSFEGQGSEDCGLFGSTKSVSLNTKTVLEFDTTSIPAGAIILSASLTLSPKVPVDLWTKFESIGIGCGRSFDFYDWSTSNNYYMGASAAKLSRITTDWNNQTPYLSFQTTDTNQVDVNYDNYTSLNCTALIQDMVTKDTKYGIMFEIAQHQDGVNFLDFCAGNQQDANNVNNSNCTGNYYTFASGPSNVNVNNGLPCDCTAPHLQITYKALVDSTYQVCRPNIVDSATNPYRWGMLGNWRVDRAYTYYADRKESDASITATNIRKEGTLENFSPFWKMTDSALLANPDTSKWVWNSAVSLYNRKGFEIENYDPLGRYNSGRYGYNQSLPVAVSQNSKYREALVDGFEDYSYQSQNCVLCPSPREFDFVKGNNNASIGSLQSHTGLYSLKVNAGAQASLSVPITTLLEDTSKEGLSFKIDSTGIYNTTVVGKGGGITGSYYGFDPYSSCGSDYAIMRVDTTIDFNWGNIPPFGPLCSTDYTVTWNGFMQAPQSGNFIFYGYSDYMISLKVDNQTLFSGNSDGQSAPVYLSAGSIYPVTVQYTYHNSGNSSVELWWSGPGTSYQVVPKKYLYPQDMSAADTVGSVVKDIIKWCIKGNSVTPQNMINPVFSPLQDDHLTLSAWVRIDAADCNTMPALNDVINVSFDGGVPVYLKRTGVRIEGWQRYESNITVPANANTMSIVIQAPAGNNIFLDDIKMEPFNGSAKSFIYNPVNLRLMAALDENNYATFYEYDDDGTLIRVKKETERGIMTIQETRSALQKGD